MTPGEAIRLKAILDELKKRGVGKPDFTDYNFPVQQQVLADPSRAQAWQCTRRAGKSTAWSKKCLNRLASDPGGKALYLALTLDSAKGILWDMIEQELDAKKLSYKGYRQEGRFELWNGSTLRFYGVDSSYKEMKRLLGQAYVEVGIDEAGSMTIDMQTLVYQMIWPALSDRTGNLTLLGTPENIPQTFFQSVTENKETALKWSIHKWTAHDNPYMAKQWARDIDEFLRNDPNIANTSWFKTHYLNQWCADDDLLIVRVSDYNLADKLPERKAGWLYVMGVDLGFNDASAFVVWAYHPDEKYAYVIRALKSREMDLTDVANQIKILRQQYPIYKIVVDGANKQGVEEMKNRHALPLEVAEKTDKATQLRIMSDEVRQGTVRLLPEAYDLRDEWAQLQWKKGTSDEDPRCENHLSDATLYSFKLIMTNKEIPKEKTWSPDDQMKNLFEEESRRERERLQEMRFLF